MEHTKENLSRGMQEYLGCLYDPSLSINDIFYGIALKSTLQRGIEERHFGAAVDYISELQQQNAELLAALNKYGQHKGMCAWWPNEPGDAGGECNCGYEKAIASVEGE